MRGNHVSPFAVGCLVFFTCSDNVEVTGDFCFFSVRDKRLFYSATGLFHGGFKKLDGTLTKGEFFSVRLG